MFNTDSKIKQAVVIGASSGFGKAIAKSLNERDGWAVHSMSRSLNEFDVRDEQDVESFFAAGGGQPLHAVIYSAGIAFGIDKIEHGNQANWLDVMHTNAMGLMYTIKHATPMLAAAKGTLIAIGSIASQLAYSGGADYCASKAAMRTIMKTYREESAGTGIRVCLIEPGLGATDFQKNRYQGDLAKAIKHYTTESHGPIRQLDAEDLAGAVSWVLDQPAHVNIDELVIKPIEQVSHGKLVPVRR